MSTKVLISRIFPEIGERLLKEAGFEVTAWDKDRPMTQSELVESAQKHDAIFCTLTDKIDKDFFNACPSIKLVSQFAVGFDNIDVMKATEMKIPVGYTPDALSEATADVAFGLMITAARKMFFLHKDILKGNWGYFRPNAHLGLELKNKTLGIVGLGRIGYKMAERCKGAYKMQILYHNRSRNEQAETELGAELVDFDRLLAESDVVSVHCALTTETKELFNREVFKKMKPTSIFVNTARGLVHNEKDLIEALENKTIWGAGLDVTNPEPMKPDNPLLQMDSVAVLPHIGSSTIEARSEMARMAATNIIEYFKNGKVPFIVNPEVLNG